MSEYSMDLRVRVVRAYENGEGSYQELADRFEVSWQTVGSWCRRQKTEGHCEARPHGGRGPKKKVDEKGQEILRSYMGKNPDATLKQCSEYYLEQTGVILPSATVWRALWRMGLTHKKNSSRSRKRNS